MSKKFKVAVVNSHPIQYFAPLYSYLSRSIDMEVTALYCSDSSLRGGMDPGFKQEITWDVDLLSGYRAVFLGKKAKTREPRGFFSLICPEIWGEVRRGGYDAIWLHGYGYAAYVLAFLAAKSAGIPVFMRSETTLGLARTSWRKSLRDVILRQFYKLVNGFLAIGTANADYYRSLGVPHSKIFPVPYTVDNERFISAANVDATQRCNLRKKYGLPADLPVVLYASKFMRRKHPDDLIEAALILKRQEIDVTLFMVGSGEMERELRDRVAQTGLENVVFAGFINQAELPLVYTASDVFVLPAENEPWGLIVNEVMCAGRPVLVGYGVGCVPDLVKDGVNGFHVIPGKPETLAAAMAKLVNNETLRQRMGQASLQIIQTWSYAQCHIGLSEALNGLEPAR